MMSKDEGGKYISNRNKIKDNFIFQVIQLVMLNYFMTNTIKVNKKASDDMSYSFLQDAT